LTRLLDELFADVKGAFVFDYLDDLVYSRSVEEHEQALRTVLRRFGDAGFTLNSTKMTIGAREVTYLGHCLSSRGITVLPERVAAIREFPRPTNLRSLGRFIGMVGFYSHLFLIFLNRRPLFILLRKRALNFYGQRSTKQRLNP